LWKNPLDYKKFVIKDLQEMAARVDPITIVRCITVTIYVASSFSNKTSVFIIHRIPPVEDTINT
jgi:hypothetical protein